MLRLLRQKERGNKVNLGNGFCVVAGTRCDRLSEEHIQVESVGANKYAKTAADGMIDWISHTMSGLDMLIDGVGGGTLFVISRFVRNWKINGSDILESVPVMIRTADDYSVALGRKLLQSGVQFGTEKRQLAASVAEA